MRFFFYTLCTLCTTCDAATFSSQETPSSQGTLSTRQLSEVWRENFPPANVGMAPSTFSPGSAVPQPRSTGAGVRLSSDRPHPAVARIVVPEDGATAYGSGTLIDVREGFGLVITNWHVVRDATGTIEVLFPEGFTSKARALKVDADWDLAALVIWRPSIEPVSIAGVAPQPGDPLTICGYGQGDYRCATGRCTQYYAPRLDFPRHMVELDVEARQGDSGGPIFNRQGELAGVLFGAGQGTTLGSFGGRVGAFLATLAPDIGQAEKALAADEGEYQPAQQVATLRTQPVEKASPEFAAAERVGEEGADWPEEFATATSEKTLNAFDPTAVPPQHPAGDWQAGKASGNLFEQMKTVLAVVGLLAIVVQVLRVAR